MEVRSVLDTSEMETFLSKAPRVTYTMVGHGLITKVHLVVNA